MTETNILWGTPASQPSRAVAWACLIKGLGFDYHQVSVGKLGLGGPVQAFNPSGQVPTLQDGGFTVYEAPAILIYLAEKHGWRDLWPGEDLHARTRVHQYLHFHHNFTRRATLALMAPHVTVAFREVLVAKGKAELVAVLDSADKLETGRRTVAEVASLIEAGAFKTGDFLCGPHPTIADIVCYEELAQLRWAGLFGFEGFPNLSRWLEAMQALPFHETAHRYNTNLGDIATAPNTIERFAAALGAGVQALAEQGVRVRRFD